MTRRVNTAEGQPSGTALTAANSGAGSGDAFQTKTGSGALTFSNAQAAHGAQSLRINETTLGANVTWSGLSGTDAASRAYIRWVTLPAAAQDLITLESASGAVKVQITAAALLRVTNVAGTALSTATTAVVTGQWYRVEVRAVAGTGTGDGTIGFAFYLHDNAAPVDAAYLSTTVNAGTTAFTAGKYGKITGAASQDAYWDGMAFNDAAGGAFIGPVERPAPVLGSQSIQRAALR